MPHLPSLPIAILLVIAWSYPLTAADDAGRVDGFRVASMGRSAPERTLLATLQGLVNKSRFRLWIRGGGMNAHVYEELARGAKVHELASVWEALDTFKADVQGMVVFTARTPSVNIATSLCGPLQAVAVEESLLDQARARGLTQLADARGMDQLQVWRDHRARFGRGILVEQDPAKDWHLRDFAVARNAFVFWQLPADEVVALVQQSGPGTTVFGWGADENQSVKRVSQAGGDYVAADWSSNLSALEKLPVPIPERPRPPRPAPAKDGERIVAFVMSDGDNLCFVGGRLVDDPGYFGSPHRGSFSMTWEMAPRMADLCSMGLRILYQRASAGPAYDDFVMGPSGAAYCFPNHQPDRDAYARLTASYVKRSGMDLVTLLNDGGGMEQAKPMLEQPEVAGVLYKDWAPYNARKGAMLWHRGKPCVSYRYLLWEGLARQNPEDVATAIAAQPDRPTSDPDSYALINVHAWSWKKLGGPMAAVKRTVDLLPPGTRVVTTQEFVVLLKDHIGARMR